MLLFLKRLEETPRMCIRNPKTSFKELVYLEIPFFVHNVIREDELAHYLRLHRINKHGLGQVQTLDAENLLRLLSHFAFNNGLSMDKQTRVISCVGFSYLKGFPL